jgi:hypothetical protein
MFFVALQTSVTPDKWLLLIMGVKAQHSIQLFSVQGEACASYQEYAPMSMASGAIWMPSS